MKKGYSKFLTIIYMLLILGGLELIVASFFVKKSSTQVEPISNIEMTDISDLAILYAENMTVSERYAFKTVKELKDFDNSPTETYYVYDASQPMDNNELVAEYYIVHLTDKTGEEYVASLCVRANKSISKELTNCPLTLSACVSASPLSGSIFTNSDDRALLQIRESALAAYCERQGLSPVNLTFEYLSETAAQHQAELQKSDRQSTIFLLFFGILLFGGGLLVLKKQKTLQKKETAE